MKRFLMRLGAEDADVEDFVQETFLRGFASELKGEISAPKSYLFQVARNILYERGRKNTRRPTEPIEDYGGADILIDETQADAEAALNGRRKLALFAEAVANLPPQCRQAFMLRRVDGLQYKQIAKLMNISVSTVEKHVTAGLLKCNAFLRERGYQPSEFGGALGKKAKATAAEPE